MVPSHTARTDPDVLGAMDLLVRACAHSLFEEPTPPTPAPHHERTTRDWSAVDEAAETHYVTPLVASSVTDVAADDVPEAVQHRFESEAEAIARTNLLYTSTLHDLLERFREAGVRAIPYKGPVLAAQAYGSVTDRPFIDLDFLVDESQRSTAETVLQSAGFTRVRQLHGLGEVDYANEEGVAVDLHYATTPRYFAFDVGFETLWQHRSVTSVAGREVPTLSPVDRLLLLSIHGGKHLWYRLGWTCDVAALMSGSGVPVKDVLQRADQFRCRRMLALGLQVVDRTFDTTIGSDFERRLDFDAVDDIAADLDPVRFAVDASDPPLIQRVPYHWRLHDRPRDRLQYLARLLTIPSESDRNAISLPEELDSLYRLVRPARIAWQLGRQRFNR